MGEESRGSGEGWAPSSFALCSFPIYYEDPLGQMAYDYYISYICSGGGGCLLLTGGLESGRAAKESVG